MNGIKPKIALDTNAAIVLINGKQVSSDLRKLLDEADLYASVITRIELYAKPGIIMEEIQKIDEFLSKVSVNPLDRPVETVTIELRKAHPKIKLPDAIVVATAVVLGATLLTNDTQLLKLSFGSAMFTTNSGFTVQPVQ